MQHRDKKKQPDNPSRDDFAHLWHFESMDRVNRAMQGTNDLEQVMKDVLDCLLSIFECDRAWLVYPCDPESPTWQVPMERTRPDYPGVLPIGVEIPLDPVGAEVYRILRNTDGPVKFGVGEEHPVPKEMQEGFRVQSFLAMAFYPKVGKAWSFGLHQCSHARTWTFEEERLFQEIGRRLSDVLTVLLMYRDLQESENHSQSLLRFSRRLEQSQSYSDILNAAQDEVKTVIGYQNLWVYLLTEDRRHAHAIFAGGKAEDAIMAEDQVATLSIKGDRMLEEIVEARDIVVVEDARTDERTNKAIVAQLGNRTIVNVPIIFFDRNLGSIGTGTFGDEGVRIPTPSERKYLMALSSHMATSMSRIHLLAKRRQMEKVLHERDIHSKSLLRLSQFFERAQSFSDVLDAAQEEVEKTIGYKNLWAYLFTPDMKEARLLLAKGPFSDKVQSTEGIATINIQGDRMMEEFVESKEIMVVADAQTDERTDKKLASQMGNRTIINVPILLFDRHMGSVGVGTFYEEGVRIPTELEKEYLSTLASHMAVTLDRIHLSAERALAEHALRENEEKFRTLIEQSAEGIMLADESGLIAEWNSAYERITGLKREQALGQSLWDIMIKMVAPERTTPERKSFIKESIIEALRTGKSHLFTAPLELDFYPLPNKDRRFIHQTIFPIKTEKGIRIASIMEDVTERKRAEEALHQTNRELRAISNCNQTLLRATNEQDLLNEICRIVCDEAGYRMAWVGFAEHGKGMTVRPVASAGLEGKSLASLNISWADTDNGYEPTVSAIRSGKTACIQDLATDTQSNTWKEAAQREYRSTIALPLKDENAQTFGALTIFSSEPNAFTKGEIRLLEELAGDLAFGVTSLRTRAERERAENALWESSQMLKLVLENMPAFVFWKDTNSVYLGCNRLFAENAGLSSPEKIIGLGDLDLPWRDTEAESYRADDQSVIKTGRPKINYEETQLTADGHTMAVRTSKIPLVDSKGAIVGVLGTFEDITERKQHELEREAIITVSAALRHATTRVEILSVILDQLLQLFKADGTMIALPSAEKLEIIIEMGRGKVGDRFTGLHIPPGTGVSRWVIENKQPYLNNNAQDDPIFYRSDLLGEAHCVASAPLITQERSIGALWIARRIQIAESDLRILKAIADIAANAVHRINLHEQMEQQLHRLLALHKIDLAISGNFDLKVTLNVILGNVRNELQVDAADILLLDPITHTLDFASGIGFRTRGIESSQIRIGDDLAGRSVQERIGASCLDLRSATESFHRSALLTGENFTSYFVQPLINKGQILGVLEVFTRQQFAPERDWLDYFETLSTQTSIAIESSHLFENLQRSNNELMLAYDATIEGWSLALDLRDRETEGHTRRVMQLTLELAEKMKISDSERLDIKRGALLHDIGKMGVPDAILLKPGPLTPEEWVVMRQHPEYALKMLSSISYLKKALDIPYCHHEHWDGGGYPRGLRYDEIPLSARIFTIVDVFDALTSNRPYRKAWSAEQAHRFIEKNSGKLFDPQVVKAFLSAGEL